MCLNSLADKTLYRLQRYYLIAGTPAGMETERFFGSSFIETPGKFVKGTLLDMTTCSEQKNYRVSLKESSRNMSIVTFQLNMTFTPRLLESAVSI